MSSFIQPTRYIFVINQKGISIYVFYNTDPALIVSKIWLIKLGLFRLIVFASVDAIPQMFYLSRTFPWEFQKDKLELPVGQRMLYFLFLLFKLKY